LIDETDEADLHHRTPREAAERCLGLLAVVTRSLGRPRDDVLRWLDVHQLNGILSLAEREFLVDASPPRQAIVDFGWRAEALAALIWALGGIDDLEPLNRQVDLQAIAMFRTADERPEAFLGAARLRPADELDDAETFLYEQHWRVHDAQLNGTSMPPELDGGIVYERRYALSWLVGWGDDWDDVPTDT